MVALCLHFAFVLHYTLSAGSPSTSLLDRYSSSYSYPYFHQSWKLFVPYPKTNYHIYARARTDKGWTAWTDLFEESVSAHQRNRLAGYELRVLTLSSATNYLGNFLTPDQCCYTVPPVNRNFLVFNKQVKQMLMQRYRNMTQYEVRVYYDEPGNQRVYEFKNLR